MSFRHLRNVRGFFSDYYLGSVFGRGAGRGRKKRLSDRDTEVAYRRFVRIYERAEGRTPDGSSCRERFIRPLVRDVLGFHLGAADDRVHGLFASAEAEAGSATPLVLAYCGAWDEDLGAGRGGAAPIRRVEQALAATDLSYGFLTTGERLRLVRAPGDGPRGAYLEVDFSGLAADEDPESFAAFYRLFHVSQFLPGANSQLPIRVIEHESREHAEKVSEDLKRAVFTAAESLVEGLIRDAVAREELSDPSALSEDEARAYRNAALTCLYRILFILYAEARDPRLEDHKVYLKAYSIHGLVEELLRENEQVWPENRSTLWARLKALFRIYDQGLPQITPWEHIPPRGGDFFKADTPEGHILDATRLSDRIVARMLLDLTTTLPHRGVGRERVSFRELDIENLGAVYEGLLEYEPRVAQGTTLEVRIQGRTFALSPSEVVRLCAEKALAVRGDYALVEGTEADSLHPDAPLEDDEEEERSPEDEDPESEESGEAEEEDTGIKRGTALRLVRCLEAGDFHFVPGAGRKGSGSFYTPLPLVQDLVRHAIEPLALGKKVAEIEALRVLDPACGSAHFLVEAMRFLGRELHRAYVEEWGGKAPPAFTRGRWDADWKVSDEEARATNSEARAWCKRRIAERCLFGVDLNPTAVNLARVALWIESLAGDRPLTSFEHHVRCGNSLLGSWLDRLDQPPLPSKARRADVNQWNLFAKVVRQAVEEAAQARRLIDRAGDAGAIEPESIAELEFKDRQQKQAEKILAAARLLFDLRSASAFLPEIWGEWSTLCSFVADPERLEAFARSRPWWRAFEGICARERFFHWELEYPEVFLDGERAGFDAVLGNPPWDKVIPSKIEFYGRHDDLIRVYKESELDRRIRELQEREPSLKEAFAGYRKRITTIAHVLRRGGDFPLSEARSQAAHEDVSKYFVDRATRLVAHGGHVGLVVPSVVYNGDGCVGIRRFLLNDASIRRFYGFENRKKIFPIHSSYKFVSLVFRKGEHEEDRFEAAFMRHNLTELEERGPKPWLVQMTREEVQALSPETYAFLEFRSPRDQEIVRKMHDGKPALGGRGLGGWGATFVSWRAHAAIYNAAEDKGLWTDPESGRLYSPTLVLGQEPDDPVDTIKRMRACGFWPVFEGKHIDQHVYGIKPIRWWLSVEQARAKYDKLPPPDPMLVFRETASNTNERTCIAAVLPERSAASHTLSGIQLKNVRAEAAGTVLNSFCFDFALRLRTAGTHVSFTYIKAVPVPPAHVANHFPILPSAEGWRFGLTHITEDANLWPDLWRANRAVAEAYGLDANDFEHILTAFPVFARKRPEFFAYLKERLHEWKAEAHPRAKVIQLYLPSEEEPAELPLAAETPAELPSEDDEYKS